MLGSNVLEDLEADQIPEILGVHTVWGNEHVNAMLKSPTSNTSELKRRQLPLLALRNRDAVAELHQIGSEIEKCIAPHTKSIDESCGSDTSDPRIQESVNQVFWNPKSWLSYLNTQPTVISGIVTWKSVVLPLISVIMPILAVIVPFFVLKHSGGTITVGQYMSHLRTVLASQVSIPPQLRSRGESDVIGTVVEMVCIGITIFTFLSSIWNQIVAAKHLRTIAADLKSRSQSVHSVIESCQRILAILNGLPLRLKRALRDVMERGENVVQSVMRMPEGLAGFGYIWNNSAILVPLHKWIGEIDCLVAIAQQKRICFPEYTAAVLPLQIDNLFHPSLSEEKRVCNTIKYTKGRHALLTGPNRGGKSTLCKAVGLSILSAQTFGFAWASSMKMHPFAAIETALSPADELGKLSLFEAEIEFARDILHKAENKQSMFVMMDEIFHSTNAADGLSASRIFLDRLYGMPSVTSIISTHYRELVENQYNNIDAWAMDASDGPTGRLKYTYKLVPGVSDKSSVMEILRERGLFHEKSPSP
jgi:hypothetical protein